MPFKFRLKRTRRYDVSSKNAYLVCVHLLDKTLIECTLATESTGQECLLSISQRISIGEPSYFGLRYMNKKLQFRWVDLDKPLKRQLDKYAHSPLLYFGVMYYVANAHKIQDEMTRYQYFLQLKTDVIEGKLPCTPEQAVVLAGFSVQVEFGDHDYERHTQENLKDFVLLPRKMTTDDKTLAELTQEVANAHHKLQGVPPAMAELQYIIEAQQLQDYGLEYYPAKDEVSNELLLGASFVGIFVKHLNGQPTVYFKWNDIVNLTHSKRMIGIETSLSDKTVQFQMDDPDTAKYVWKMLVLQHRFYRLNKNSVGMGGDKEIALDLNLQAIPDIQQTVQQPSRPQSTIEVQDVGEPSVVFQTQNVQQEVMVPQVMMEDYGQGQSQLSLEQSQADVTYTDGSVYNLAQGEVIQQQQQQQQHASLSQPTASHGAPMTSSYQNTSSVLLPQYRPSPDYDSVMQQRLAQQVMLEQNLANSQVYTQPEIMAYSQPEIHHLPPSYAQHLNNQINRTYHPSIYTSAGLEANPNMLSYRPVDRTNSMIIQPTYSTPELNTHGLPTQFSTSENRISEALLNHYKPPPPYPRPSSSTPDLASQTMRSNLSNSPDLVSRRNINNSALMAQSRFDESVEDLAVETQNLRIQQQLKQKQRYSYHEDTSSEQSSNTQSSSHRLRAGSDSQSFTENLDTRTQLATEALLQAYRDSHMMNMNYASPNPISMSPMPTQATTVTTTTTTISAQIATSEEVPVPLRGSRDSLGNLSGSSRDSMRRMKLMPAPPPHLDASVATYKPANPNATTPKTTPTQSLPDSPHLQLSALTLEQAAFDIADSDTDSIDCLDVSKPLPSEPSSSVGHSKCSSLDTSSLSQVESAPTSTPPSEQNVKQQMQLEQEQTEEEEKENKRLSMGPLKLAALNGLTISRGNMLETTETESRAPRDERRKNLENKLEEGQVFKEFEEIPKKRIKGGECTLATRPENKERNRFKDVLPYDNNRMKLTPTKDNPNGYINASPIKLKIGREDFSYISSQGPMPNTVADFWQMIWENNVQVIAMLTNLEEQGRPKCFQYWPQKSGSKNRVKYGNFQVTLQFSTDSPCYVTRGMTVKHLPSSKERFIYQLQYTDWPDHGCPENIHGFLTYFDEIESVCRHALSESPDGKPTPVVVHCSAGVGRTGVAILTQIMKACLEYNENIDIPSVLQRLRDQRMFMVQTLGQYSFVYKTLVQYLKNTRLI